MSVTGPEHTGGAGAPDPAVTASGLQEPIRPEGTRAEIRQAPDTHPGTRGWTPVELAARVAKELKPGRNVCLGAGLAAAIARAVPPGTNVTPWPATGQPGTGQSGTGQPGTGQEAAPPDVAVLTADAVTAKGDIVLDRGPGATGAAGTAQAPAGSALAELVREARRVIVMMGHLDSQGRSRIVAKPELPPAASGCVNLIITDLAVIEVRPEGLVLRELAPEVTVDDVVAATEADLLEEEYEITV